MNLYKKEKAELIRNGKFDTFKHIKKDFYNNGFIPDEDPKSYGLTEEEKDLCDRLEKSTKRKKSSFRRHALFMHNYYAFTGLLTLSYSERTINSSTLEWKKEQLTEILSSCFDDYIGKFEISPNGRLHFHAIVGWFGYVETRQVYRDGHINQLVTNKTDLTELWFGHSDENGQPSKIGIYDLVLIPNNKTASNKAVNYSMKSLNSMESYIQKDEMIDLDLLIDDELVYQVNTSNVIVKRGTPYHEWNKAKTEQDKYIKRRCRVFDTPYYEQHKYDSMTPFYEWVNNNRGVKLTDSMFLIDEDFKFIQISDFLPF